jgi:hypothetical protein
MDCVIGLDPGRFTGVAYTEWEDNRCTYRTAAIRSEQDVLTWLTKHAERATVVVEDFVIPKSSRHAVDWLLFLMGNFCRELEIVRPTTWKQQIRFIRKVIPARPSQHEWDALAIAAYYKHKSHLHRLTEITWTELPFSDLD